MIPIEGIVSHEILGHYFHNITSILSGRDSNSKIETMDPEIKLP
jgi:hypothetical protein